MWTENVLPVTLGRGCGGEAIAKPGESQP